MCLNIVDYGTDAFFDYALTAAFSVFSSYITIRIRKLLLLESIKNKRESESWRSLLMLLSEGVVVCDRDSSVLFSNSAFRDFILRARRPNRSQDNCSSSSINIGIVSDPTPAEVAYG